MLGVKNKGWLLNLNFEEKGRTTHLSPWYEPLRNKVRSKTI